MPAVVDSRALVGLTEAQRAAYIQTFHDIADPRANNYGGVPMPVHDQAHRAALLAAGRAGAKPAPPGPGPEAKACPKCDAPADEDAKFCSACGAAVDAAEDEEPVAKTKAAHPYDVLKAKREAPFKPQKRPPLLVLVKEPKMKITSADIAEVNGRIAMLGVTDPKRVEHLQAEMLAARSKFASPVATRMAIDDDTDDDDDVDTIGGITFFGLRATQRILSRRTR